MMIKLESAIAANDAEAVQLAILDLGNQRSAGQLIDDEVAFQLLAILRKPDMWHSPLAGHVFNFFEFEADSISQRAKDRCAAFIQEWGNQFTDFHSVQVVGELREGPYLKEGQPKAPRKKPRHPVK